MIYFIGIRTEITTDITQDHFFDNPYITHTIRTKNTKGKPSKPIGTILKPNMFELKEENWTQN